MPTATGPTAKAVTLVLLPALGTALALALGARIMNRANAEAESGRGSGGVTR